MDESYLLALGFDRWISALPFQTAMYAHKLPARDGARLYISLPTARNGQSASFSLHERQSLEAAIHAFFQKHGGKYCAPEPELLG